MCRDFHFMYLPTYLGKQGAFVRDQRKVELGGYGFQCLDWGIG